MSSLSLALSQSFLNTFQVQIYKFSDTVTWDSSIISFTWWNFWSFLINTPALASLHSPWWATLFQEEQTIFLFIENRLHCYNVLYIMAMGQRIQSNGFTKHLNNQWNSRTIQIGQCEHIVKFITFKTQLMYRFIHWFYQSWYDIAFTKCYALFLPFYNPFCILYTPVSSWRTLVCHSWGCRCPELNEWLWAQYFGGLC